MNDKRNQQNQQADFGRIPQRPILQGAPLRSCPACPRSSRRLLAVAIVVPGGQVIDLCRGCARTIRYGSPAEREAIALAIAAHLDRESVRRPAPELRRNDQSYRSTSALER